MYRNITENIANQTFSTDFENSTTEAFSNATFIFLTTINSTEHTDLENITTFYQNNTFNYENSLPTQDSLNITFIDFTTLNSTGDDQIYNITISTDYVNNTSLASQNVTENYEISSTSQDFSLNSTDFLSFTESLSSDETLSTTQDSTNITILDFTTINSTVNYDSNLTEIVDFVNSTSYSYQNHTFKYENSTITENSTNSTLNSTDSYDLNITNSLHFDNLTTYSYNNKNSSITKKFYNITISDFSTLKFTGTPYSTDDTVFTENNKYENITSLPELNNTNSLNDNFTLEQNITVNITESKTGIPYQSPCAFLYYALILLFLLLAIQFASSLAFSLFSLFFDFLKFHPMSTFWCYSRKFFL